MWEQARSFCPTLPLSSDVSQWLPMNEAVLSIVVGRATNWNASFKASRLDNHGSTIALQPETKKTTPKLVSFNSCDAAVDSTSSALVARGEPLGCVFGPDELAGLRAVLHAIAKSQDDKKCVELKAQLFLQGWDDAAEVFEVFAQANVAFTYVDINVNGTSAGEQAERRWESAFKTAATNWTRYNRDKEPLSNIRIAARRCCWLNAAVLRAITTFGEALHELDLSYNRGSLNNAEGADFVAESQHDLAEWDTRSVPVVDGAVEEHAAHGGDCGAEITPSMLQDFANECKNNKVKGLKLSMKSCGLVSLHLQMVSKISLSSLDASQQQPRLRQHNALDELLDPECFSPAAIEWFFKAQRDLWKETSSFPEAPFRELRPRCATCKGTEYCWGLRTFKAESCGLTDAHIDKIREASLPSLTKVNVSGNRLITVQAQEELRDQQTQLVSEHNEEGFTLNCSVFAWVDLLLELGFRPSSQAVRTRQDLVDWATQHGLEVLKDEEVQGIILDEQLPDGSMRQSRSGLSRHQSYGSSSSSAAASEPDQNSFACHLNGVEVCRRSEEDEEDDDIGIDSSLQAKERRRLARRDLGLFIWRLINQKHRLADLLVYIKEMQEKGQMKPIELQLLGCRWHNPHIELLRKSGCRIKRLAIGWNQQELRRQESEEVSEIGPLTFIETLDIKKCSDQFLEAFSEFVIFGLVLNKSNLTTKGLTFFRDRQNLIDGRHRGLYRSSGRVEVTACNNVRHGDGSSWDAASLAAVASLPGLRKLTLDLNDRDSKLQQGRSKRKLTNSFDERALVTLVQTIASQQNRGIASKNFCLSIKSCGRLSLVRPYPFRPVSGSSSRFLDQSRS